MKYLTLRNTIISSVRVLLYHENIFMRAVFDVKESKNQYNYTLVHLKVKPGIHE